MRVLFHVQYLLGIGHLQRSLRIAEALVEAGVAVTLVQGGPPVPELARARGIEIVQLPPIRARDATFALVDAAGEPLGDALRAARRDRLLAAFADAKPGAVVVEGFPFARRAFRFELDPLIAAAKAAGVPVVSSVRDIPTVRADPARLAEIVARVRNDFAGVLVHGDPGFIPFDAAFPAAPEIAGRLHYTGYVASDGPRASRPPNDAELAAETAAVREGEVLVSVGGGAAGRALVLAALAARRQGCFAERGWRILAGASVGDGELAALRAAAPPGVALERFRTDFAALLRDCHVSVSQAGYNTVLDLLAARVPAVLVPFAAERETEQTIRAEHLASRGAAVLLRESELAPASLAAAIETAAARDPAPLALDVDGARRSAVLIREIMVSSADDVSAARRSGD
ncbi:MAG TPA: glycosyltransferase [Stellaceae bacterium]|jgi:predicted glycosyltransferase|nr:glycosyltransferase [Stellaceae bacterium]